MTMSSRLSNRVNKLEQSNGQGFTFLLYTDAWSQERLDAEMARLKETYDSVLPILLNEADMAA